MTTYIFANNVNTTLASGISSSATTLTLSSSANLPASVPAGEYFALTLNDAATRSQYEIVYATAISGSTLTIERGKEGTTAQAWLAGDYVYAAVTAGELANFSTSAGGVTSWNTRTGAVVPVTGDYTWSQIGGTFPYVTSVNTRTGAVVLTSTDINTALGYTAANNANVLHTTGNESASGVKTFTGSIQNTGSTTPASGAGVELSYFSGSGRVQAYDRTASAWKPMYVNGSEVQLNVSGTTIVDVTGSGATVAGLLTCTTFNATSSDRRLKRNIRKFKARPLHRSVPFVSYTMKADGWSGLGAVAQSVQSVAPEHVGQFEQNGKRYLSLNYAGMAYEQAIWASLEIDRLTKRIEKLERSRLAHKPGFLRRLREIIW